MELSKYLRDYSRTIPGKQQLLIGAYAKALEIIPRQLCDNAGFDATNILNKLRAKHAQVGGEHAHTHVCTQSDTVHRPFWLGLMGRLSPTLGSDEPICTAHRSQRWI